MSGGVRYGRMAALGLAALLAAGAGSRPADARDRRPPSSGDFENPGVYSKIVDGRLYEWIPTRDVNFEILRGGKVRIVAPATKRSFSGTNDCRRFIYDHVHKRLAPADEKALFGAGLALPPGNYGFAIMWIRAGSYDEVFERPWDLTSNPKTYASNSGRLDYVNISIVPTRPPAPRAGAVREVVVPYDLQRVSWLPHYQVLPHDLTLPPDKGFGITRLLWDIPLEQVYRKVTHIQYMYSVLDHVPDNKKWRCKRGNDHSGKIASVEWLIRDHSPDKDFITFAQMDEDFGNHGFEDHLERAQRVLKGIYRRLQKERGVTSPNQTRLYDDYFSALGGYSNSMSFLWDFDVGVMSQGLSGRDMARTSYFQGKWTGECRYFSAGAYEYRNWFQGGYLDSYAVSPEGIRIYNEIYNYERKFMAAPDRRVAKFGWSNAEGVNSTMYRPGVDWRLHFDGGDIIRSDVVAWPFHMMLNEAFWALLLGHDYVLWHSSVTLVSDINAFGDSWAAGAGPTRWQPAGGRIVKYDPDDPTHPRRVRSPEGQFPNNPHMGESGAFAGAWLVSQITSISDRTSRTVEYCPFSYRVNGGPSRPGYADSDAPENGSLGNAKLSRFGVANYGQANIVKTFAAKKPICIYTEGRDGAAVIYHNVYCGLTDRNTVTVTTRRGKRTFSVTGNSLHVLLIER